MHFIPTNFTDPDFDPAYTAGFQLLIILNQEQFSFAVRHPVSLRLVHVSTGNYVKNLFTRQNSPALLFATFQKTIVALETNSFCLVPNAVFTDENMQDFASFLLVKEADVILKDALETGENTVIFTFPAKITDQLIHQFADADLVFAPKGWIKTVLHTAEPAEQKLYLYLAENELQILYPDQKNIRFYNKFVCTTTDELIYYTGLVINQLKLNNNEVNIIVSGWIDANSEQILRLKQFFKNVDLFGANTGFKQQPALQQHQVTDFLGLY